MMMMMMMTEMIMLDDKWLQSQLKVQSEHNALKISLMLAGMLMLITNDNAAQGLLGLQCLHVLLLVICSDFLLIIKLTQRVRYNIYQHSPNIQFSNKLMYVN